MTELPSEVFIIAPVALAYSAVEARSGYGHEIEICEQIVAEIVVG